MRERPPRSASQGPRFEIDTEAATAVDERPERLVLLRSGPELAIDRLLAHRAPDELWAGPFARLDDVARPPRPDQQRAESGRTLSPPEALRGIGSRPLTLDGVHASGDSRLQLLHLLLPGADGFSDGGRLSKGVPGRRVP